MGRLFFITLITLSFVGAQLRASEMYIPRPQVEEEQPSQPKKDKRKKKKEVEAQSDDGYAVDERPVKRRAKLIQPDEEQ